MSSLFRLVNNFSAKRENVVKEALINVLEENSKEIQYEYEQDTSNACLELCEVSSSLCSSLEAIYLHGLKDSFLWQTINVLAGSDVERRPEPSFWSPLMIFLHKQDIEQIQQLTQITSEIGQCRAWIRFALNESLFSSYLSNMRKNVAALHPYYKKDALLRDSKALEAVTKIVQTIEVNVQFQLPVNSSLLNHWPDLPLQLSGLWTPTLKACPISSGVDIAGSLLDETVSIPTPQPLSTNELFSESISNSPFNRAANFGLSQQQNERQNLDLFLQKIDEMEQIGQDAQTTQTATTPTQQTQNTGKSKRRRKLRTSAEAAAAATIAHGNSLSNLMQMSWSSDLNSEGINLQSDEEQNAMEPYFQRSQSMTSATSSALCTPLYDRCSYNALLRKHERSREVDWTEVWEKFLLHNPPGTMQTIEIEQETDDNGSNDSHANSEFELVNATGTSAGNTFDIAELQQMVEMLCKLPQETGLDAQGFLCQSCQHPLSIGYAGYYVCGFSGQYYCRACMHAESVLIPARIIYNWDFRKYAISKRAHMFLHEFRNQPFIDLQLLNPHIYYASDAMAELQSLRIRLNFIRAYLYTCSSLCNNFDEIRRLFFGREYLFEHIHQYSIGDLNLIQRGTLAQQLQKAYKLGETHVLKCPLCSLKGFICEICKRTRVLYPFHIDTTFRCLSCGAVFHAQCLNEQQPCPKCKRKQERENLAMLEAMENLTVE